MNDLTSNLAALATEANTAHQNAAASARAALSFAIAAGKALARAKSLVPHGEWAGWLAGNVTFSVRTSQVYMRLARHEAVLEANAQRAALLTVRDALSYLADPMEAVRRLARITEEHREEVAQLELRLQDLLTRDDAETLRELLEVAERAGQIQNRIAEARLRAARAVGAEVSA